MEKVGIVRLSSNSICLIFHYRARTVDGCKILHQSIGTNQSIIYMGSTWFNMFQHVSTQVVQDLFHVFYHPWLSQKRENPYAPCMVDLPTLGSLRG